MRHLILAACLLLPGAASAHAILMESQPPPHGTLDPATNLVVLHFNSRIDHARSRLVLRGPPDLILRILPDSAADTLSARVNYGPGAYVLRWQVLATDGHITRGDVPFTIKAP